MILINAPGMRENPCKKCGSQPRTKPPLYNDFRNPLALQDGNVVE